MCLDDLGDQEVRKSNVLYRLMVVCVRLTVSQQKVIRVRNSSSENNVSDRLDVMHISNR